MHNEKKGLAHFIQYHNAVPIVLGILFLSTTATLAASPAVRDTIYKAETEVQSIDNSYILSVDLEDYPFAIRITKVLEDEEYFYVSFELDTIDVLESVWQDVTYARELRVTKALMGGAELEAYVENELAQLVAYERDRLTRTQENQKKLGLSEKKVATAYSGLIGRLREPSEQRLPQYVSEISRNDPLYVDDPVPLVTWDANAEPVPVAAEENEEEEDGGPIAPPQDVCPDMEGLQINPSDCAPSGGGGGGTEPSAEEPPTEEPPTEEPPAEEPPAEEPPAEEPPAESGGASAPSGDAGGDTGGASGSGTGGGESAGGDAGGESGGSGGV